MNLIQRLTENTALTALVVSTAFGDIGKSDLPSPKDFGFVFDTNVPSILSPNENLILQRIPVIEYPSIGYFLDENHNGKRDIGEIQHLSPYMHIQNIPKEAIIGAFVPEELCWGKVIRVVFRDVYTDAVLFNQVMNCSDKNPTNSYVGKPLGLFTFNPEKFKNGVSRNSKEINILTSNGNGVNPHELTSGKRFYSFECVVEQGFGRGIVIGRGNFYVDYNDDK